MALTGIIKREDLHPSLLNELDEVGTIAPSIGFGMNTVVRNLNKASAVPKFTIKGKSIVNLLGRDGNCEDVSKWSYDRCTATLDATNKMFGSNGFKLTLTATAGVYAYKILPSIVDITKYYLMSAYVKNGNLTGSGVRIMKNNLGGGNVVGSNSVSDATKFTRLGVVVSPSDLKTGDGISILSVGNTGEYAYVDGIMINEITAEEYALGADTLLAKYPYVDGYACLTNPYIEVRHDNLVKNGNCEEGVRYWVISNTTYCALSVIDNKFKITTTADLRGTYLPTKIKPNTDYYISGNVSGNTSIKILTSDLNTTIREGFGSFNSGNNSEIGIYLFNSITGIGTFDSIMLVEGTVAPTEYKPCRIERTVLEGDFADGDIVTYENGEVSGLFNTRHKTLFGKDYDWKFNGDNAGYKSIYLPFSYGQTYFSDVSVKYDGKPLKSNGQSQGWTGGDQTQLDSGNNYYLSIADLDTGWRDTINPNNDEVKAFMNGWKAITTENDTRYKWFISVLDPSAPPDTTKTTATSAWTSNATTLSVTNGSLFAVGDTVWFYDSATNTWNNFDITAISGNALTVTGMGRAGVNGQNLYRGDNGTTNTTVVNYCKSNVAHDYEGYKLHYKLANPKPLTDTTCHVHGDIPLLDSGDNYVFVDSGMVLDEVANFVKWSSGDGNYYLNDNVVTDNLNAGLLKNKTEAIISLYKNLNCESAFSSNVASQAYGKVVASMQSSNFDANAQYTVDYKILATQAPQIGSVECNYNQDIVSILNDINEEMGSRQKADSSLDTLVDLSIYEKLTSIDADNMTWCYIDALYIQVQILFSVPKKVKPKVTITTGWLKCGTTDVTSKALINNISISTTKVSIQYKITDSTTVSNIKANGVWGFFALIADCKPNM